jgi:hypothetical protein
LQFFFSLLNHQVQRQRFLQRCLLLLLMLLLLLLLQC